MKTLRFFLLSALIVPSFLATSFAQESPIKFMTTRDLLSSDSSSGINLRNNRNSSATVYGLYVRQYAYVSTNEHTCQNATVIYPSTQNTSAGSFLMPATIDSGKSAAIGKNFLYNMIYEAIYYENIIIPVSPPGCALPGCTWGTDTNFYNWCIFLGALAPVFTSAGYTANVPPSADLASNAGVYDYNLVSNYVTLGPISCNDQTLTCAVANEQTQSFS